MEEAGRATRLEVERPAEADTVRGKLTAGADNLGAAGNPELGGCFNAANFVELRADGIVDKDAVGSRVGLDWPEGGGARCCDTECN